MSLIYIKNADTISHTWAGQGLDSSEYYNIQDVELTKWQNHSQLLSDIGSGIAIVAKSDNGLTDIADVAEAINFLKGVGQVFPISPNAGNLIVEPMKPEGSSFARATHDFTNKTTWWPSSVSVVDEVATTSDDLTYSVVNDNLIDVINGIVNRQDTHQDLKMTVKVDDVVVTSGITINHALGDLVFDTAQTGKTIKVSYNYATNSQWSIKPEPGKILIIEHSEVQFAEDVEMNSPVKFEVWINNPYFAVPGHPYEGIPRIPYEKVQYNSIRDIINESNLGTGYIPQVGDLPTNVLVFPFNYVTQKQLLDSYGAELVVSIIGDVELTGSYGTATFYLISKNED